MKRETYEVEIGSPPDYEELVAYIHTSEKPLKHVVYKKNKLSDEQSVYYVYRDEVAILDKEEGPNKVRIKFSKYVLKNEMYVDDLLKVIKEAKEELLK